jgi:hypothetical protein
MCGSQPNFRQIRPQEMREPGEFSAYMGFLKKDLEDGLWSIWRIFSASESELANGKKDFQAAVLLRVGG